MQVAVPSTLAVNQVRFFVDNQLAGNGSRTGTAAWSFALNTTAYTNGPHALHAVVNYAAAPTGTTAPDGFACRTNSTAATIANTAIAPPSSLELTTNIQQWRGPTNYPTDIAVVATLVTGTARQNVTTQASYTWKTISVGHIENLKNVGRFNSGPTPGEGRIIVRVVYSNVVRELAIPVVVQPGSASTSFPAAINADGTQVAATPRTAASSPTAQNIENGLTETARAGQTQGDPALQECLVGTLGAAAYQGITAGQQRISFSEYAKSGQCFAQRKFVIPANLAPIAPDAVKALPVSKQLTVEKMQPVSGNGNKAIVLSGVATPGKTIFIYVFSEPLVLSTKAGDDGRWTYTLEDPLAPGNHEAYVTVEGESAQPVRSNVFNFAVAVAAPSDSNPLGLSFQLKDTNKPAFFMNAYIIGSGLLLVVALLVALRVIRRGRKTAVTAEGVDAPPTPVAVAPDQPESSDVSR